MTQDLDKLTEDFLSERPKFYSLIRPYEAYLFQHHSEYCHGRVLDFGCGDGFFAEIALLPIKQNQQFKLIGVDIASSRIDQARDFNIYHQIKIYNGERLPFADNSFNSVMSNSVLEHVADLDQTLHEIGRVLKPGGYFLTTVMTEQWEQALLGKKIGGQCYVKWLRQKQEHRHLLSVEDWTDKFQDYQLLCEQRVGYLPPKQSRVMEVLHYLSLPSLLSYKLFRRWVLWPNAYRFCPLTPWIKALNKTTQTQVRQASSVFFVLQKKPD
jgi:ubiquinone/menaquinone biosynthesis C-methylase UbiE